MNFNDDTNNVKNITYQHRGVKEILNSLLNTPIGIHQIVVYPNIEVLRETYFHYIKRLLEDNNEMIIFLPYYESAESVKKILSSYSILSNKNDNEKGNNQKNSSSIDVKRYTHNGSLVIIDSQKTFPNVEGETTTTMNHQFDKYNNSNSNSNSNSISHNDNDNNSISHNDNDNFSSLVR